MEDEEEEEGNHDTITSLAGAKMMQWYHKALTGSRKSSSVSLNQVIEICTGNFHRNLFKICAGNYSKFAREISLKFAWEMYS